jgi:hypothetical protein
MRLGKPAVGKNPCLVSWITTVSLRSKPALKRWLCVGWFGEQKSQLILSVRGLICPVIKRTGRSACT